MYYPPSLLYFLSSLLSSCQAGQAVKQGKRQYAEEWHAPLAHRETFRSNETERQQGDKEQEGRQIDHVVSS